MKTKWCKAELLSSMTDLAAAPEESAEVLCNINANSHPKKFGSKICSCIKMDIFVLQLEQTAGVRIVRKLRRFLVVTSTSKTTFVTLHFVLISYKSLG